MPTELSTINPDGLYDPLPNGYSHVVKAQNMTGLAFIAGQGGEDLTGKLSPDFKDQVFQAYKNLQIALDGVGAKPSQVLKLNTYVVDYDESKLGVMTEALITIFKDWLPAQTLVPVPRLALDGMLFEVDATVVLHEET